MKKLLSLCGMLFFILPVATQAEDIFCPGPEIEAYNCEPSDDISVKCDYTPTSDVWNDKIYVYNPNFTGGTFHFVKTYDWLDNFVHVKGSCYYSPNYNDSVIHTHQPIKHKIKEPNKWFPYTVIPGVDVMACTDAKPVNCPFMRK